MKKIIVIVMILNFVYLLNAKEYILNVYKISIDVNSTKPNGFSWDFTGGGPDIFVTVDGKQIVFSQQCKDQYRCEIEFISKKKNHWYFEIYDKDVSNHDLIGKGECSLKEECNLGSSKIYITE